MISEIDLIDRRNLLAFSKSAIHLAGVGYPDTPRQELAMKTILAAFLALGMALTGITATAHATGTYVPNRTTVTGNEAG